MKTKTDKLCLKYNNCNDKFLLSLLNRYFFDCFRRGDRFQLELYLKSQCNSKCKYCYLQKHGDELYPSELQEDSIILKNVEALMDFYIENKFRCNLHIFTGEAVLSGFIFKVFDIILDKLSQVHWEFRPQAIIYPENMDFIENENLIEKMQSYVDAFSKLKIDLIISASVDGGHMDENRTRKRSPEFYPRLNDFMAKNLFASHPMVSSYNIEKWSDNYDWWKENIASPIVDRLMMLEVRDNDWTNEKIDEYLKFLNHVIDKEYENFGGEEHKLDFMKRVFDVKNYYPNKGYDNIVLFINDLERNAGRCSCSITNTLTVRMGDLAIVPCHRLSYPQFIVGYFNKNEENKIESIEYKNAEILVSILNYGRNNSPKCHTCDYRYFCLGPCLGSNFETTGDLFITGEKVCNLFKAKTIFLILKYQEMGLLDLFFKYGEKNKVEIVKNLMAKISQGLDNYGKLIRTEIDNTKIQRKDIRELGL